MTLSEVKSILGSGKEDARSGSMKIYTWQGGVVGFKAISVTFEDDRVTSKAILD